jgi:serine/threonine-protein kinase
LLRRGESCVLDVTLIREEDLGAEFVHIPRGPSILGGDPEAFYPEPRREAGLDDFLIARRELSPEEYFQFLNDPQMQVEVESRSSHPYENLLPVDPNNGGRRLWSRFEGEHAAYAYLLSEPSVRGVSRLAAERYVAWLNDREQRAGGRRRFALPSADELEKAARGADGRLFPWGNRFDWSLASTWRSNESGATREQGFPTDCSPYGVYDLAGGLAEFTRTDEDPPDKQRDEPARIECRIKGGSWFDDLEPYFHIAGHTRERTRDPHLRVGFRVVAYPAGKEAQAEGR